MTKESHMDRIVAFLTPARRRAIYVIAGIVGTWTVLRARAARHDA